MNCVDFYWLFIDDLILMWLIWLLWRFITADKVAGGRGFRAVWTEVKNGAGCDQFLCKNNSFCIARHLQCDGTVNCGSNDDSDEAHCNYQSNHLYIFIVLVLVVCHDGGRLLHRCSPIDSNRFGVSIHLPINLSIYLSIYSSIYLFFSSSIISQSHDHWW